MCQKGVDMTFQMSINDFYFDTSEIWEFIYETFMRVKFKVSEFSQ